MLCQNCGKNEATTHIKQNVNGKRTEYHLCSACAEQMGYGDIFSDFSFGMDNMLSNFFSDFPLSLGSSSNTVRCKKCGSSFEEIVSSGMLGCDECYDTFKNRLSPLLQRIHGKSHHVGKIANSMGEQAKKQSKLECLKNELKQAVETQDYEQAAILRDKIKEIEEDK